MPIWAYEIQPVPLALLMFAFGQVASLAGLFLARRYLLPRLEFSDGINDAISGTVQAIGVFYGITVGLIAAGVWNTYSSSSDLVAREASCISSLYHDVRSLPEPSRGQACSLLRRYVDCIIEDDWPRQRQARHGTQAVGVLDTLQDVLYDYEPRTEGDRVRYAEILASYNRVVQHRQLRIDAVDGGLSTNMWFVIWAGAAVAIGVAYLFNIRDWKIHAGLVSLMAAFLGLLLFMIVVNDRPFYGEICIQPESYRLLLAGPMCNTH